MPDWIPIPGWLDLVDIGLVAAFGWLAISYVRRTRARARRWRGWPCSPASTSWPGPST